MLCNMSAQSVQVWRRESGGEEACLLNKMSFFIPPAWLGRTYDAGSDAGYERLPMMLHAFDGDD